MEENIILENQLDLIRQSLRRGRVYSAIFAIGLIVFAYFLYGVWFLGWDHTSQITQAGQWFGAIFIVLILMCSALCLYRFATLLNINNAYIIRVLTEYPERILWVYEQITRSRNLPSSSVHNVFIWFTTGRVYALAVKKENAQALIEAIATYAPQTLRGYTPENQEVYKARVNQSKLKSAH